MVDLAPAEREKLDEFQVITSFPEDQYDKVVRLLRNNYWNLEVALSKYFDGMLEEEAAREPFIEPPDQYAQPGHQREHIVNDIDVAALEQLINGNGELPNRAMLLPQLPIVRPISNRWRSNTGLNQHVDYLGLQTITQSPLLFILLLIPRTLTLLFTGLAYLFNLLFPPSPDQVPLRPTSKGFNAMAHFRELTHEECPVELYKGDFNEAFEEAKQESRFILLVVIGSNDKSTQFLKRTFNNDHVVNILKEERCLVYVSHAEESQGNEIARCFKVRALPSVFLLGNVASGPHLISSMSLLAKVPTRSTDSFLNKLKFEVEKYKPELTMKRLEQEELRHSRMIRELQDKAYEESLIADKIKKSQKEEEENLKAQQEQVAQWLKEQELKWLCKVHSKFNDENDELNSFEKGQYATIRFKMPHGAQVIQKFSKEHTLKDIYSFVALKNHMANGDRSFLDQDKDVDPAYNHKFDFELISPFPRYVVPLDDTPVKEVQQLWPNGSLLIEFASDDDDDDDD
ncbi:unnamed protein product [Cyberlindnera jadinii]|uniref:UBX-domain-containing protein n=1 Tax=Cyberlindnera jadinii (strain ATCC 18201 / CBS 1600 / BCRC 20928 / JCM 3617 / NBRC 0987 / NRRL Y-1542) TaxID=983966 RepID=A0A0H5C1F2_CYBJN|nr:UBX-domain-containing protein [Cyberlindnera jadinii NRRL Y-1542]ODV74663.1 UBX-domain-containing protein [Cyberlindnera jadinii NRRL Y-1542]CEP21670.1 unnamed protein product [Cyberlindnera jadinii]